MPTRSTSGRGASANTLAYVLELLGSLFYVIAAVYVISSFRIPVFALMGSSIWLPFFYGGAMVGTVLLFVVSFTNLMRSRSGAAYKYAMMVSILTGFAWLGLTLGNMYLTLLVLFGFILSIVGSAYGMVELND
jgi:hypothetical protein